MKKSLLELLNTILIIPRSKSDSNGRTSVKIYVLQGEQTIAKDNRSLGKFLCGSNPPTFKETPQNEVSFEIDGNRILKVSVPDQGTSKEQSIMIGIQEA